MTASVGGLLIRADASTQMGIGHVMRCLALAQAWQERGGAAQFAVTEIAPALEARLRAEGMGVLRLSVTAGSPRDAEQTAVLAQKQGAAWVLVDGYQFGGEYQRAIKQAGLPLLFVDDYAHAAHYYADLLLNQNMYAHESMYSNREPNTQLLLGASYILLRREFWPWRGRSRDVAPIARRVLVTLGGSDPDNLTRQVLTALEKIQVSGIEVAVAVGASNPHLEELRQGVRDSRLSIRLVHDASDISDLMAWADVAVSAGGSTCWELAFMGLPSALLVLADNQRLNVEGLQRAGCALNLGSHKQFSTEGVATALTRLLQDRESRTHMSRLGQQLVNGEGSLGVTAAMLANSPMHVRSASQNDIEIVFHWANDPETRRMSFTSGVISWEEHQRWYQHIMDAADRLLMIVELREGNEWKPAGQVRIDSNGTVSLALDQQYRGRHLAAPALRAAILFHNARFSKDLSAYVKPENEPSQKAFRRAGFRPAGRTEVSEEPCLKYVFALDDQSKDGLFVKGDWCVQNSGW